MNKEPIILVCPSTTWASAELKELGFKLIETSRDKVDETWQPDGVPDNGDSTWITIDGDGVVHQVKNTSSLLQMKI